MTHVTILAFEVPPLLRGPITRPPPLPTPRDQPLQWQKLIPRQGRLVPLLPLGNYPRFPNAYVSLGRPVSVPAVPDICHIGRNGSRATPRLKITTISLSHSIAVLPTWRVCMSAERSPRPYSAQTTFGGRERRKAAAAAVYNPILIDLTE